MAGPYSGTLFLSNPGTSRAIGGGIGLPAGGVGAGMTLDQTARGGVFGRFNPYRVWRRIRGY